NALAAEAGLSEVTLEQLVRQAHASGSAKLFNNAAQAWNHAIFWLSMSPRPTAPGPQLSRLAQLGFGGLPGLRAAFLEAGSAHFGSGWVWLLLEGGALKVATTHDAGTPLTGTASPLLVCDLWEHAYYLDHRNDRAAFLAAWWDTLANWPF